MRNITTILLTIISLLACIGQEADTLILIYYTEADKQEIIKYYEAELDNKLDSCNTIIVLLQRAITDLELDIIADTFSLDISDDRIKVSVEKRGHDVNVAIIDGFRRLNSLYLDYSRTVRLMDSTYQVGYININPSSTKGVSHIELDRRFE